MTKEKFTQEVLAAEKSLFYVAKAILKKDEDCADAMQNAILSAYEKQHTLKEEKYFKTWLTRILINECYSLLRGRKDMLSYEEYVQTVPETGGEAYSEVYLELVELEEQYRIPFILHYVEGYSAREIAEILGTTEGGVKNRLYRGRNRLKERLKGVVGYE